MSKITKNSVETPSMNIINSSSLFSAASPSEDRELSVYGNLHFSNNKNNHTISLADAVSIDGKNINKNMKIIINKMEADYKTISPSTYTKHHDDYIDAVFDVSNFSDGYWYMVQLFLTPQNVGSNGTQGFLASGIFCYDKTNTGPRIVWVIHNNYHDGDILCNISVEPSDDSYQSIENWSDASYLKVRAFANYAWEENKIVFLGLHFSRIRKLPLYFPHSAIRSE